MSIGENIKRIRTEKKMTQKELGEKLGGISQQQIGRWENDNKTPKIETIRRIATALGVYISDLVDDWSSFSKDDFMDDLTDYSGGFYGKEAPKEKQNEIAERLFGRKADICQKMDLLNDAGQEKAIEHMELLAKVPEYRKDPEAK